MSMDITAWLSQGKPQRCTTGKKWYSYVNQGAGGYRDFQTTAEKYFCSQPPGGCRCDAAKEHVAPTADLADWLARCPGCKAGVDATAGLAFTGSGFAGAGVTGGVFLQPAPPAPPRQFPALTPSQPAHAQGGILSSGEPRMTSYAFKPTGGGNYPTGPGQPSGGGYVGQGIGIVQESGWGASSTCSGPYNFNPVTGGCDLKPASWGGWANYPGGYPGTGFSGGGGGGSGMGFGPTCPSGWDMGADGLCHEGGVTGWIHETVPGGKPGVMAPPGAWTTTDTPLGAGYVPQAVAHQVLRCPPGYVLVGNRGGNAPGMEVCLPKTMAGVAASRKWKRGPRPLLTGGEMKTLRKIDSLEKKVKKAWERAGKPGQTRCRKK